jgi:signal transduction histidine kinase
MRLETLYDPFRRTAEGDRYAFSGTGLGLSLCRRLVNMMGSELQLESRNDWGTRFFFELDLPLVNYSLAIDTPSEALGRAPDALPRLTP